MSYDAGRVEATLTLDRSPFEQSLKEARRQVEEFEKGHGVREEKVKLTGLEEAKARLKQLDQRVQANVGVKTAEARAEIAALERELAKLHRKVEAHVGVEGVPKVLAEIEAVERALSKLERREVKPKVDGHPLLGLLGQADRATRGMGALATAAVALGPAIVPVAAVATAGIGGLASGLGAAAIGAGSFGLVLKTQLSGISAFSTRIDQAQMKVNATFGPAFVKQHAAAVKQLELLNRQLTDRFGPGAIAAVHSWQKMKGALQSFQQSFNPQITSLIVAGTHTITTGLKLLKPVTAAAGNAFVTLTKTAGTALQSPFWKGFFGWMAKEAGPAIVGFGRVLGNLAHGFAGLMMAFGPMSHGIMNGLVRMTAGFARWATHLGASGGFHRWVAYVRTEGPVVLHVLGDLVRVVVDLAKAFAPYGATVLKAVQWTLHLTHAFLQAHPAIAKLAAAIIPLTLIAGRLGAFKLLGTVIGHLSGALKIARVAFLALGGPVTIVIAAVAALVAGAIYAYTHFKAFRDTVKQVAHVFSTVLGPIVKQVGGWIKTELGAAVAWVKQHWPEISKVIVSVMTGVARFVKLVLHGIGVFWRQHGHQIMEYAKGAWQIISGVIKGAMHIIKGVIEIVLGLIHGHWGKVWHGIKDIARGVWDIIKGVVRGALHIIHAVIKEVLTSIARFWGGVWDGIKRLVHDAWEGIKRGVSDGIHAVSKFFADLPGQIVGFLSSLPGKLFDIGKNAIQGLINGLKSMDVGSVAAGIANTLSGGLTGALGIKSPSTVFHGFGVNIMQGLTNGIHAGGPAALAAIQRVVADLHAHMSGAHGALKLRMQLEVLGLQGLAQFERAVTQVGVRLDALSKKALVAFADRRAHQQLAALDRGPQSRELASLTGARDAEAAVVQRNQDAQTLMAARMTDDPAQVAAAQKQIDARKRDERIAALTQELADKRTAISNEAASAKAGHDAQANSFARMVAHQTDALERALAQRRITLAHFAASIHHLLAPVGLSLAMSDTQAAALRHGAPGILPTPHDRPRPRLHHGGQRAPAQHVTEHHNYQVNVPPAVQGQHGFDARHASAQLGQALVRHGRNGRRR